jgi:hypothetical protein
LFDFNFSSAGMYMPRNTSHSDITAMEALKFRLDDCTRDLVAIGRGNDTEEDRVLLAKIQRQVEVMLLSIIERRHESPGDRGFEAKCAKKISEIEKDIAALGEILPYPREYLFKW